MTLPDVRELFYCGSPSAMGNLVDAIKLLLLNAIVLRAGGAQAAAVWAVLNSLSELAVSIVFGVPQAAAPMTGVYYAAMENSALRILIKLQLRTGMLLAGIYGAVLCLFSRQTALLFALDGAFLGPAACLGMFLLPDMSVSILSVFFYTTGRYIFSDIIVVCRKLRFPVGTAFLLMAGNGYIWLFLPLCSVETLLLYLLLTGFLSGKSRKSPRPLSRFLLLDDHLERENMVLDFSIVPLPEEICRASEQIGGFCEENRMDAKQTMRLQLSIEELLSVLAQKISGLRSVDMRVFAMEKYTGLRIRCAGRRYDPFSDDSAEESMMGVHMLAKMASSVDYSYALGTNTINIRFEKKGI